MMCVRTVKFNVLLREDIIGPIVLGRGLRQGDPMSPCLFIIATEGLTALIKKQERMGLYHGCKIARTAPSITHLLFCR